jgi:NAD(P)-dependent dehydrogenase (short-subunit alcohol dehydrogenase family)
MNRVWLITGANSGFGRAITEAAVAAGDIGPTRQMADTSGGTQPGDPAKAAAAILTALGAPHTPAAPATGRWILGHLDSTRADIRAWEELARDTRFSTVS